MIDINDIKDIVLFFLVIAVIYLLFFKKSTENFETTSTSSSTTSTSSSTSSSIESVIKTEVNNKYLADIDAIRNLAQISKKIMTNNDTLTIPTTTTTFNGSINSGAIKASDVITANGGANSAWIETVGDIKAGKDVNVTGNIGLKGVIKSNNAPFLDGRPARVTVVARELSINGNIQLNGRGTQYPPVLCIGNTCINENDLKKLLI